MKIKTEQSVKLGEREGRKRVQDWLWSQLCVCTAVSLHLGLALFLSISPHLSLLLFFFCA